MVEGDSKVASTVKKRAAKAAQEPPKPRAPADPTNRIMASELKNLELPKSSDGNPIKLATYLRDYMEGKKTSYVWNVEPLRCPAKATLTPEEEVLACDESEAINLYCKKYNVTERHQWNFDVTKVSDG